MPVLRRVSIVLLAAGLLALIASPTRLPTGRSVDPRRDRIGPTAVSVGVAEASKTHREQYRRASGFGPAPVGAPKLEPALSAITGLLAHLYPTTTTTTSMPTPPQLVIPPHPQQPAASNLPIVGDYHTWPDWPLWQALGMCETGLRFDWDGPRYVSFAGMARSTFNMDAHAIGLPDWYLGYPPADQIRVARYGHFVEHQFWGCGVRVPGW